MLDAGQRASYGRDGFLVLRAVLEEAELARLDRAVARAMPVHGQAGPLCYPEPGRYTLAGNCLADPDLGFVAAHEGVLGPVRQLLDDDPVLTAFVVYDRTPGGPGLPRHNDYKRWRPVGSSMHWLFAILPLSDFDAEAGPLFVAPGSHRLERVRDRGERALHVDPALRPAEHDFVDPELRRGDLLLMNMHVWHSAAPNGSARSRVGLFNKYAAAGYPPATGYFLYDEAAHAALGKFGDLLAVHSDKPIATTRLVLEREGRSGPEILVLREPEGFVLPGGPTFVERAIPDWDVGNYIAALQASLRQTLRIETPWASYVGDFDEEDHLCRVYGFPLNGNGFPVPYEGEWRPASGLASDRDGFRFGFEPEACARWLDPTPVRGKGLTQAQSRVDQYAY